jgi:hypothetical protein
MKQDKILIKEELKMAEFEKNEVEVVDNDYEVTYLEPEEESENNGGNGALMLGLGVAIGALGYRFIAKPIAKKAKIAINKVKAKKAAKQKDNDCFEDKDEDSSSSHTVVDENDAESESEEK